MQQGRGLDEKWLQISLWHVEESSGSYVLRKDMQKKLFLFCTLLKTHFRCGESYLSFGYVKRKLIIGNISIFKIIPFSTFHSKIFNELRKYLENILDFSASKCLTQKVQANSQMETDVFILYWGIRIKQIVLRGFLSYPS